jgi:hypothetical protein
MLVCHVFVQDSKTNVSLVKSVITGIVEKITGKKIKYWCVLIVLYCTVDVSWNAGTFVSTSPILLHSW